MQDENVERECVAKAATFQRGTVGLSKDETVSILKSLRQEKALSKELAEKLTKHFASVDELLAKSAVFKEIGSGFAGDAASPAQKLEAIAKQIKEQNPALSEAEALTKAYAVNPKLYEEMRRG